MKRIGIANS